MTGLTSCFAILFHFRVACPSCWTADRIESALLGQCLSLVVDSIKFSLQPCGAINYGSTLTRPLRRTLRIRYFCDVSKVKESSFFLNRTSLTLLRFLMRIFWKILIQALPAFIFQGIEEKKTMFIHTNQP